MEGGERWWGVAHVSVEQRLQFALSDCLSEGDV